MYVMDIVTLEGHQHDICTKMYMYISRIAAASSATEVCTKPMQDRLRKPALGIFLMQTYSSDLVNHHFIILCCIVDSNPSNHWDH